ncbi:MAG: hypothetical protein HZC10_03265 [Nitrospirae bacterium]|nr:hypothetical protein [Nitrospirota bacterium]
MKIRTNEKSEYLLMKYFKRNGYIRQRNEKLAKLLGQRYKKGYEVRFVAKTENELREIRLLLNKTGFKLGKPFKKHKQLIEPVYGKQAVEKFLSWKDVADANKG